MNQMPPHTPRDEQALLAPQKARPAIRVFIWLLFGLLILCVFARIVAGSAPGRMVAKNIIESTSINGTQIEVGTIQGDLLSDFSMSRIILNDENGAWLELSNLTIDWTARSLVTRSLNIEALNVERIDYLRPPVVPEATDSSSRNSGGRSWINQLDIETAEIEQINVAMGGSTPTIELQLSARAVASRDTGQIDLGLQTLSQTAGATDQADILLTWSQPLGFQGKGLIRAPRAGALQALAPISPVDDLSASFLADGEVNNWTLSADLQEGAHSIAVYESIGDEVSSSGHLSLDLVNSELLSPITQLLGSNATLDLELDTASPRSSAVSLDLRAETLSARMFGSVDIQDFKLSGPMAILARIRDLEAVTGVPGLTASSIAFSGEIDQKGKQIELRGAIDAQALATPADVSSQSVKADITAQWKSNMLDIVLDAQANDNAFGAAPLNTLLGDGTHLRSQLTFNTSENTAVIELIDLRSPLFHLSATGDIESVSSLDIDAQLHLIDLYAVTNAIGGAASFQLSAIGNDDGINLEFSGTGQDLTTQEPALNELLGPQVKISSKISALHDGSYAGQAELAGSGFDLATDAVFENEILHAESKLSISQFTHTLAAGQGLDAMLEMVGPSDAIEISLKTELASLIASDVTLTDSQGNFDGLLNSQGLIGQLNILTDLNQSALSLQSSISTHDAVSLNDIQAEWRELQLAGNVVSSAANGLISDLTLRGPLNSIGIPSEIEANATLSNNGLELVAELAAFSLDTVDFKETHLSASGPLQNLAFKLATSGQHETPLTPQAFAVDVDGQISRNDASDNILTFLKAQYGDETLTSTDGIRISRRDTELFLEGRLEGLDGTVKLSLELQQISPFSSFAKVTFNGINLERCSDALGRNGGIRGKADGVLHWRGVASSGQGDLKLSLSGLSRKIDSSPIVDAHFSASSRGDDWLLDLSVVGEDSLALSGRAQAPFRVQNGWPQFDLQRDTISAELQGDGRLGALWALVGVETVELDGDFDLSATASAPLPNLRPKGELTFRNGAFEHANVGLRLKDIAFEASFDEQAFYLNQSSAKGLDGGRLSARGDFYLDPAINSNLFVDLDELVVVDRIGQKLQVSGRAVMEKAEKGATLQGELAADYGLLNITKLSSGQNIQTVEIAFMDETESETVESELAEQTFPFTVDLQLVAPNQVYIQGAGLDVEMTADVNVKGRMSDLSLTGEANVVRGGFDLAGQNFDFDEGDVRFNGKARNAVLNFSASRQSDGVTSFLQIQGTAIRPELVFSSTPQLPEDEVLSRLLFGRSAAQLTALEAAQLAAGVASIAGEGGVNPLSEVRNAFGLDRLTVTSDDEGAARVGAGKYIADDVYLEFRTGQNDVADIAVEWKPQDNVEIGTEFQQDGDARVTIQWTKEFDDE